MRVSLLSVRRLFGALCRNFLSRQLKSLAPYEEFLYRPNTHKFHFHLDPLVYNLVKSVFELLWVSFLIYLFKPVESVLEPECRIFYSDSSWLCKVLGRNPNDPNKQSFGFTAGSVVNPTDKPGLVRFRIVSTSDKRVINPWFLSSARHI